MSKLEKLLLLVAAFTTLATLWLAAMSLRLHHPGYQENAWMGCFFATQSIATIIAFAKPLTAYLRALTLPGSALIAYMGVSVLIAAGHSQDVEGYVLLIGFAFIVQAALVVLALALQSSQQRTAV